MLRKYNFSTIKILQQNKTISAAFSYMNVGRWETSKFFVYELCVIFEIYNWYNFLLFVFFWINYNFLYTFPRMSLLYLRTDLKEYNDLLGKHIDHSRDLNIDPEAFLFVKPFITYFNKKLDIDINLIELYSLRIEQQRLQDEQKKFEKLQPKKLKSRKKTPPVIQKVFFDLKQSYIELFPHDPIVNKWLSWDFFHMKNSWYYCYWEELIALFLLDYDYLEWLNLMHVIWSYINKWIWSEVKNFLFFHIIYYFPMYAIYQNYFRDAILKNYFAMQKILNEIKIKDDLLEQGPLPFVTDLDLFPTFLTPVHVDKKLPWIDFTIIIVYMIKQIKQNFFIPKIIFDKFFSSTKFNFFLKKKRKNIIFDPLQKHILNWLQDTRYFYLRTIFSTFIFEFSKSESIFSSKLQRELLDILEKFKWKYWFYWKWRWKLWVLAWKPKVYLSNDSFFFWPFFHEFNVLMGLYKLKRKKGWPPKKYTPYFDSELEFFCFFYKFDLFKIDQFDFFLHLTNRATLLPSSSNLISLLILFTLIPRSWKLF